MIVVQRHVACQIDIARRCVVASGAAADKKQRQRFVIDKTPD